MKTYKPTTLEKWISDRYIEKGIIYPWELTPKLISGAFDIDFDVHFAPAYSSEEYGEPFIVVDKRTSREIQTKQYFHELCHILRHDGDQRDENMPEAFRQMQEADAHSFTLFAAIPYHMIDFSQEYTVVSLQERFNVPWDIAQKRFNQIRDRLYYYKKPFNYSKAIGSYTITNKSQEVKRIIAQLNKQVGVKTL